MKTLTFILFVAFCSLLPASAQIYSSYGPSRMTFVPGPEFNIVGSPSPTLLRPKDPLRLSSSVLWQVVGEDMTNGWVEFRGKVVEVQPGGIRVRGTFTGLRASAEDGSDFFVANFPYEVAEGDVIGRDIKAKTFLCAKIDGVYTYHTVMGGSRTIKKLDYGDIYVPPPPTAGQLAAAKLAQEKKNRETEANTVKWVRDQADAGDAFSQFRMGERYLKGDGVEKDDSLAKKYLTKASAQGNQDARDLLAKMNFQADSR